MFLDQVSKCGSRRVVFRDPIPIFTLLLVLAKLAQHRWQATAPELATQPVFVRSDAYVLPGAFVMGATVNTQSAVDSVANAKKVLDSLMNTPATAAELERAKNEVVNEVTALCWQNQKTLPILSSIWTHIA